MNPTTDSVPSERIFTLFSQLPAELRLQIWSCALPGPRIIQFTFQDASLDGIRSPFYSLLASDKPCLTVARSQRIPALLHTVSEARTLALAHFEVGFANCLCIKPLYINFATDAVYVTIPSDRNIAETVYGLQNQFYNHQWFRSFLSVEVRIQKLIISGHDACILVGGRLVTSFPELKTLIMQYDQGPPRDDLDINNPADRKSYLRDIIVKLQQDDMFPEHFTQIDTMYLAAVEFDAMIVKGQVWLL